MSVGIIPTKASIDANAGALFIDLTNCLTRIQNFSLWLNATADAVLLAAPYSYSQAEINLLKSSYVNDMLTLLQIFQGTANLVSAHDFRAFAKQLTGFGQY